MQDNIALCQSIDRIVDDLDYVLKQPDRRSDLFLLWRVPALADQGKHVEAAETADVLYTRVRKKAQSADELYSLAQCYAHCARGVAPGKPRDRLTSEEADALRAYVDRCAGLLASYVKRGGSIAMLEHHPDWTAIKNEPPIQRLLASQTR
jgi:hypothetical protein